MAVDDAIILAVYNAVDEMNTQLPKGVQIGKTLESPLYGKASQLESIDLVSLIMEVEDQIKADLGVSVMIADDRAMSQNNSPFLTIGTLTDYIAELLKEDGASAA